MHLRNLFLGKRDKNTGRGKIHNGGKLRSVKGLKYRHLVWYRRILLAPPGRPSLFLRSSWALKAQQIGHFCRLVVPRYRGNETRNNSMGSRTPLPPLLLATVVPVHDFASRRKIIICIDLLFLSFISRTNPISFRGVVYFMKYPHC